MIDITPFISFISRLESDERRSLLNDSHSSLFIFRLLPQQTQSLILNLIWESTQSIPYDIEGDDRNDDDSMALLRQLDIVNIDENGRNSLNSSFRRSYLSASIQGSHRCARLKPISGDKDKTKKKRDKEIVKKSYDRWECVLRFLALPSETNFQNVSSTTRDVFHSANYTSANDTDMDITSDGFQFLLLSPVRQIWSYIIELLKLEIKEGRGVRELLDVLLRMILCIENEPERRAFELDKSWNERQMNFVNHLRELGLIFIRKRKDGFFYLTPLLANLSVGADIDGTSKKGGSIIVETNFRVYAYTSSSLQLAILSSFTSMTYRFHDMSVGILTRDSVRRALQVGITADQIISFLKANCHAQAASRPLPIPITVSDQIRLWEDERKRLLYQDATMYSGFESEREFVDVSSFAEEEGILLLSDNTRKIVIVRAEGHDKVKEWWRRRNDNNQ